MKTLTLNIPEEADEIELKMTLAAVLFNKGLLSSGQAADFSGVTKRTFLENAGKYGVSILGETIEDLKVLRTNDKTIISDTSCLIALDLINPDAVRSL